VPSRISKEADRDRFYVQKDKHPIFQRLTQDEDAPFKHMKDVWVLAAAVGFKAGRRRPMHGTQHVGFWHYLSLQEDVPLIQAIAVADTGDISVLANRGEVIRIAEEYANGGIDLLVDAERADREGTLRSFAAIVLEEQRRAAPEVPTQHRGDSGPAQGGLEELMRAGESAKVEFKETARWNQRKGESGDKDIRLEQEIVQAVAGFANADGGTLLVGVNDAGEVMGLERDFKTFTKRSNKDGFEAWLTDLFETTIGKPAIANCRVEFPTFDQREVCRINVERAQDPVYVRERVDGRDEEVLWVRFNNTTRRLTTREANDYIRRRFP
jgi:dnd system-associated protein 4